MCSNKISGAIATMVAVLGTATTVEPATAQPCNGTASFADGRVQAGITFGNPTGAEPARDGTSSIGYQLALGMNGAFARFGNSVVLNTSSTGNRFVREGFGETTSDDASGIATTLAVGYGLSLRQVDVCAGAGLTRQSGPTLYRTCVPTQGGMGCSDPVKGSAHAWSFGASAGTTIRASRTLALVPFAGAALVKSSLNTDGDSPPALEENYGVINVGVGIVYKRLTVRKLNSFPVGLDGSARTGSLDIVVSMGRKSPR